MTEPTFDLDVAFHAGVALVAGGALFRQGFTWLRTLRKIENTPTARIRSLPMGSVEVIAQAEPEELQTAPISGKDCAYWDIKVEERVRSGKNSRWVTRVEESSDVPFHLRDETGRVLLLPSGAESHLPNAYSAHTGALGGTPPEAEAFLEARGYGRGLLGSRRYRLSERRIDAGERVYVFGVAQERPDLRQRQTLRINEELRDLKGDPERMREIDLDGDGEVSELEWERARTNARERVRAEGIEDRVVIARGRSGEMFVLSNRDEKELVGGLRWKAFGGVFGGGALVVGGLAYLVISLGGFIR